MIRTSDADLGPSDEKVPVELFVKRERATFAAGCFWGVQAEFRNLPGVTSTSTGYMGGHFDNPTYEDVCSGMTGHAEAVEVIYDPEQISYEQLLEVFWRAHDPTQYHRQGADVGSQYRSAIFFHNEEQRRAAMESKKDYERSGRFRNPVVTEIVPASRFFKAEDYHQDYLQKTGHASCHR